MNNVELQLDFYRRFNDAVSYLTISKSGLLLTLLGSTSLFGAKSLNCELSMGVSAALRRLDCGMISVENTTHNTCTIYNLDSNSPIMKELNKTGFNGAQILYDVEIPKGYDYEPSLRCAVLKALYTINRIPLPSPEDAAILCGEGRHISLYTALFASKPRWCSYVDARSHQSFPFPMTNLLFIIAKGKKRRAPLPKKVIERELEELRRIHPMVLSYSDIKPHMVGDSKFRYLKFIAEENMRIDNACKILRPCRIEKFAEIVNESQKSMGHYLKLTDEQLALTHYMHSSEGCMCARSWNNGAYAIVEAELADYVIRKTKDKFEDRFGYAPQFAVTRCE